MISGVSNFEADHVAASSAGNVWVYGLVASHPLRDSVAYWYDGSRWHRVSLAPRTKIEGMVTFGPGNTWAIGVSGTADVFRWGGSRWHGYYLPFLPPGHLSVVRHKRLGVRADVHAEGQKVAAYRWNGSAWHAAAMHPVTAGSATVLPPRPPTSGSAGTPRHGGHAELGRAPLAHGHPTPPAASVMSGSGIVCDGLGSHWFGPFARLDGSTWTSLSFPRSMAAATSTTLS